jgi:TrmH family RNA methyltransferase
MEIRQITSLQNPVIKHIVHLRQNHGYRLEHNKVIISGKKIVKEVSLNMPVETLLIIDETCIPDGIKPKNIYIVSEEIMQKASGLSHPEGVLAEVEMPKKSDLTALSKIIVVDKVSDPGNLGSIIRTAVALNWEGLFLLASSCDPFNDKAISAARGATFRLPIFKGNYKDLEELINKNNFQAIVADIEGTSLEKFKVGQKTLLVLSNEAHGVSDEVSKLCEKVTIPMSEKIESLNVSVAGGILMWALR